MRRTAHKVYTKSELQHKNGGNQTHAIIETAKNATMRYCILSIYAITVMKTEVQTRHNEKQSFAADNTLKHADARIGINKLERDLILLVRKINQKQKTIYMENNTRLGVTDMRHSAVSNLTKYMWYGNIDDVFSSTIFKNVGFCKLASFEFRR